MPWWAEKLARKVPLAFAEPGLFWAQARERELVVGIEGLGWLTFDLPETPNPELEGAILKVIEGVLKGYRSGLGPQVRLELGSGEYLPAFFTPREMAWFQFLRWLIQEGRLLP